MTLFDADDLQALDGLLAKHIRHGRHHGDVQKCQPPGNLTVGLTVVSSRPCFLTGWAVVGTLAAAFNADLIDGQDGTGMVVASLTAAMGASNGYAFTGKGLLCLAGLTLRVNAGTASGGVYFSQLD